jgi:hypothetical protein
MDERSSMSPRLMGGTMPAIFTASPLRIPLIVGALLVVGTIAITPAAAQTTLGTVRGTVRDPQQNVVPGAAVVVTDEATSVSRETQTDQQGFFEATAVTSRTSSR